MISQQMAVVIAIISAAGGFLGHIVWESVCDWMAGAFDDWFETGRDVVAVIGAVALVAGAVWLLN